MKNNTKSFEIVRVGWEGENQIPIVLLEKKIRDSMGIELRDIVITKKANKTSPAVVHLQFKEFVGTKKAIISSVLSQKLTAQAGDKIQILRKATEEERDSFFEELRQIAIQRLRNDILRFVGGDAYA